MRMIYGERRAALVASIAEHLSDELEIHGDESGLHLAALLKNRGKDREIALRAAEKELWLWPLSPSYLNSNPRQGFILGFGGVPAAQMPKAARLFREVLRAG
jgi:GntR family transcriptional regulator/MocR family aminotransferase